MDWRLRMEPTKACWFIRVLALDLYEQEGGFWRPHGMKTVKTNGKVNKPDCPSVPPVCRIFCSICMKVFLQCSTQQAKSVTAMSCGGWSSWKSPLRNTSSSALHGSLAMRRRERMCTFLSEGLWLRGVPCFKMSKQAQRKGKNVCTDWNKYAWSWSVTE